MALSNLQLRIERSLFEAIRLELVTQGYLPNITDPSFNTGNNANNQAAFEQTLTNIKNAKGFSTELFGHGSSQSKFQKRVPRMVIIPRRILPGDIGAPMSGMMTNNPLDPDAWGTIDVPFEASNMQIDIHLVSDRADQDRFMHSLLAKVIGQKKFIPFYDNVRERFFIKQYNYYDLPDTMEGVEEKVYSFEIPDLYMFDDHLTSVALISEITVDTTLAQIDSIVTQQGILIGPYVNAGAIHIDLSGISYNN